MRLVVRSLALLVLSALFLIGCGPPGGYITYPESGASLEGTVSYGGHQLGAAMVIARQEGNTNPSIGFVGDDGRYKLDNVPLGEVQIGVNTAAAKGQMMGKAMGQAQGKAKTPLKMLDVPAKYGDPVTSGLKTTVQKGPNTFDIVISK